MRASVATPTTHDERATLRGIPASSGHATGRARIVRDARDVGLLRPGEILVCKTTAPAWTPLFAIAAGIVTETGGALSNTATVGREYGVPAIVRVSGATTQIHNGDLIHIDGATGIVSLQR